MAASGINASGRISRNDYGPDWKDSTAAPTQAALYAKIEDMLRNGAISVQVMKTAGEPISALKLVFAQTPQIVGVASSNDLSRAKVSGIALTAALTGEPVRVLEFGELTDNFFSYPPSTNLYCDPSGSVTSNWQSGAVYVPIGVSLGSGGILIRPSTPVVLQGSN